jgi:hypothetical protein
LTHLFRLFQMYQQILKIRLNLMYHYFLMSLNYHLYRLYR